MTDRAFRSFCASDAESCLALFDDNCPEYFAPNERDDFHAFLKDGPVGYEVCELDNMIVGAFGLIDQGEQGYSLNWIMIAPTAHGLGIGSAMLQRAVARARHSGLAEFSIAASHKSAPFFARFGASEIATFKDGWGPGMDRVNMRLVL